MRDACSPDHQMSNFKWRGNKTLIRDPIHRFIPSTFIMPNTHEVIPHPTMHCFLPFSQDLTDSFVITVFNATIKQHHSANCFGWNSKNVPAFTQLPTVSAVATHVRWCLLISSPPNVTGIKRDAVHTVNSVVRLNDHGYENQTFTIIPNTGWDVMTSRLEHTHTQTHSSLLRINQMLLVWGFFLLLLYVLIGHISTS